MIKVSGRTTAGPSNSCKLRKCKGKQGNCHQVHVTGWPDRVKERRGAAAHLQLWTPKRMEHGCGTSRSRDEIGMGGWHAYQNGRSEVLPATAPDW